MRASVSAIQVGMPVASVSDTASSSANAGDSGHASIGAASISGSGAANSKDSDGENFRDTW